VNIQMYTTSNCIHSWGKIDKSLENYYHIVELNKKKCTHNMLSSRLVKSHKINIFFFHIKRKMLILNKHINKSQN